MQTGRSQPDRGAGWPVRGLRCYLGEEDGDKNVAVGKETRTAGEIILLRGVCGAGNGRRNHHTPCAW